jgi:hypothetical protein
VLLYGVTQVTVWGYKALIQFVVCGEHLRLLYGGNTGYCMRCKFGVVIWG